MRSAQPSSGAHEVLTVTLNPCLDKTLTVERFERGRLTRAARREIVPAGKGTNVARVLRTLGVRVTSFVVLGGESGRFYERLMREEGLPCVAYWVGGPTREQVTVREAARGSYTSFLEEAEPVAAGHARPLTEAIVRALDGARVVVLSGSAPSATLTGVYARVVREARRRGIATVLDTYGEALRRGLIERPTVVKPNRAECEALLKMRLRREADLRRALGQVARCGVSTAVITRGRRGFVASVGGRFCHVTPPRISEVNPTGSGDAVAAGLAFGLARGMGIEETLRLAAGAGCANAAVWTPGGGTRAEIRRYSREAGLRWGTL